MEKVQITYFGKQAMVDKDQVKKLQKKEALVKRALELQTAGPAHHEELLKASKSIIALNRTIRQNVQFL